MPRKSRSRLTCRKGRNAKGHLTRRGRKSIATKLDRQLFNCLDVNVDLYKCPRCKIFQTNLFTHLKQHITSCHGPEEADKSNFKTPKPRKSRAHLTCQKGCEATGPVRKSQRISNATSGLTKSDLQLFNCLEANIEPFKCPACKFFETNLFTHLKQHITSCHMPRKSRSHLSSRKGWDARGRRRKRKRTSIATSGPTKLGFQSFNCLEANVELYKCPTCNIFETNFFTQLKQHIISCHGPKEPDKSNFKTSKPCRRTKCVSMRKGFNEHGRPTKRTLKIKERGNIEAEPHFLELVAPPTNGTPQMQEIINHPSDTEKETESVTTVHPLTGLDNTTFEAEIPRLGATEPIPVNTSVTDLQNATSQPLEIVDLFGAENIPGFINMTIVAPSANNDVIVLQPIQKQAFNCLKANVELYRCYKCPYYQTNLFQILKQHILDGHTTKPRINLRSYLCRKCHFGTWSKYVIVRHCKFDCSQPGGCASYVCANVLISRN